MLARVFLLQICFGWKIFVDFYYGSPVFPDLNLLRHEFCRHRERIRDVTMETRQENISLLHEIVTGWKHAEHDV